MKRARSPIICLIAILAFAGASAPWAAALPPLEDLAELETICLGKAAAGGLLARLYALEILVRGREGEGTVPERVAALREDLLANKPHEPSLRFLLNAAAWSLCGRVVAQPLRLQVEELERIVFGEAKEGPLHARAGELSACLWPGGRPPIVQIDLTPRTLVRISLIDEISSLANKAGDTFHYTVCESVVQDGLVALPAGSTGKGRIEGVEPPGNMGRDARITMVFGPVGALDGTPVELTAGEESTAANKSQYLTVRVTAAGMIVLGPAGILSGMFVRGKETVLPPGTRLYVQTATVTRCFTLAAGGGRS